MKLLVANRGEIALRVFQTCEEMGIKTVAVYTKEDEASPHLTFAQEAYQISSYLEANEIVAAAKEAKATLVHPGYGFLSERAHFVRAVEKAGMIFIGPRAETMEALGEKIGAKKLAEKSKVPTLPWAMVGGAESKSEAQALKEARRIGFPLLLKASAGGGGKGMRLIHEESEFKEAAESAAREAQAAFGDPTLFLEKYLGNPRHIEVQVMGDGEGEGVHFFERECSLQRRHQKIWEEAPAPRLMKGTKEALHEAALNLVRMTKYRNAGTAEFLVDHEENFYFLEVNARLQVEHPVSEIISGVDLVRMQIECALGQLTDIKKFQPKTSTGHSIEVRIYAEDCANGFIPTAGTVEQLIWPRGLGIRIESGIEVGQLIHTQFDPMLAKLIVDAPTREQALERLKFALSRTVILGLGTNLDFLQHLASHPDVKQSQVYTQSIDKIAKAFSESYSGRVQDSGFNEIEKLLPRSASASHFAGSGAPALQQHPSPWFR